MGSAAGRRTPNLALFLGAGTAVSLMGDMAIYAVLPVHFDEMGLLPVQVGFLLSANRWVRLLTNQVARRTLDRVRPALPLSAAFALGALIAAFYATEQRFWPLLSARLLWGLCWSFIRHTGVTLSVSTAGEGRAGRTLGIFNGVVQLGFIGGTLAGGLLYDALGRFRAFVALAAISCLAVPFGAVGASAVPRPPADHAGPAGARPGDARLLGQGFLSACAGTGLITSTVGYLLKARLGATASIGPLVLGMASVNALLLSLRYGIDAIGSPVLGRVIDSVGHRPAAAAAFLAGAATLWAAAWLSASWMIVPFVVLFFVSATACSLALQVPAGLRGPRAYARYASATDLGGAVGPLLGWAGIQYTTRPGVTLVAGGALLLLGSLVALPLRPATLRSTRRS